MTSKGIAEAVAPPFWLKVIAVVFKNVAKLETLYNVAPVLQIDPAGSAAPTDGKEAIVGALAVNVDTKVASPAKIPVVEVDNTLNKALALFRAKPPMLIFNLSPETVLEAKLKPLTVNKLPLAATLTRLIVSVPV